jgi:phosphohistidine phosphatase SixA
MKSAWVVTLEGTSLEAKVIGIVSSRKSAEKIKEMVEWLYALLNYSPDEHFSMQRYLKPINPYPASYWRTNAGCEVQSMMTCGHNPWLVARLARDVELSKQDDKSTLRWLEPDRIECDEVAGNIISRVPGRQMEAPIRLPLNVM